MNDIITPEPVGDNVLHLPAVLTRPRIIAECDEGGQWHVSITIPRTGAETTEGRLATTTFWRPNDTDNVVDALNDPAPNLADVLDHLILLASRKANAHDKP